MPNHMVNGVHIKSRSGPSETLGLAQPIHVIEMFFVYTVDDGGNS
jgi:hypothetical protein